MAFLSIPNVAIRGIAACVPKNIEENLNLPVFKEGEAVRVINRLGLKENEQLRMEQLYQIFVKKPLIV